jgi:FkbM family methyltransferase
MRDLQVATRVSLRVRDPAQANAVIASWPADAITISADGREVAPRRLRPGTARRAGRGALAAFTHDLLAVGGLDESRLDVADAIDELACRLARDGVRVHGMGRSIVPTAPSFRSSIESPPRSVSGPKRTLLDAEHAEVRRYLSPIGPGRFLEIGANEPVVMSQTHHLERAGWIGVLVEPQPHLADRLQCERPGSRVVRSVCSAPGAPPRMTLRLTDASGHATLMNRFADGSDPLRGTIEVDTTTADSIIDRELDGRVDFISIDVEGHEPEVLAGLDLRRRRPRLLLIEDDMRDLRTSRMLWSMGYRMLRRTQNNNWWIPREAADRMRIHERWRMLGKFLRMPFRSITVR